MVNEKVKNIEQAFRPSSPVVVTDALDTFFTRFWDFVLTFAEDLQILFMNAEDKPSVVGR